MITGSRPTLRDLPLPAKLVLSIFLMAIGLGYISAMMQLHFRSGSRDGNTLPTVRDVVRRYSGSDWPPNNKADDKPVPAVQKNGEDKKPGDQVAKKDEPKKEPVVVKAGQVAGIKIKSLFTDRCVVCHNPMGDKGDLPLENFKQMAEFLPPMKALNVVIRMFGGLPDHLRPSPKSIHVVVTGPADKWGPESMAQAFTNKSTIPDGSGEEDEWKRVFPKLAPEKQQQLLKERDTERLALIAWIVAGAKKAQFEGDYFPLPPELARNPLTEKYKRLLDRAGKPIDSPEAKDGPKAAPMIEEKKAGPAGKENEAVPAPKVVANEEVKVKIQTLITNRCASCHRIEKKELPLDNYNSIRRILVPSAKDGKFGKMHRVINGPRRTFSKDSMSQAFFEKSNIGEDPWKRVFAKLSPDKHQQLEAERENERLALTLWLETGAPKDAYEANEFSIPAGKIKGPFTQSFLVGNPDPVRPIITLKQIDFDALVQSTHAHLLTFALLWTVTGLIFAFTSYSFWMRFLIAPSVLLAQVVDVLCWWLARLPDVGPYFAVAIMGTGALVGLGLTLQILLSLFNMYGGKGKFALVLICLFGAAGLGSMYFYYIEPELKIEKDAGQK